MYKKLLVSVGILLALIFSFSICFANDAVNGVRNVVGGAENAVEGAVKGITNASKNVTGAMENGANNVGNAITNHTNNTTTAHTTTNNAKTNTYTATRTATTGNATFMGMNATTWTWLIMGIAAIAIVALVWYYSMQFRSTNYDNRD